MRMYELYAKGMNKKKSCQVMVAQHAACPFGAVASVHAWERVGAAIAHLARKYLKIALLRYVDDMFAAERLTCGVGARCVIRVQPLRMLGVKLCTTPCAVWPG